MSTTSPLCLKMRTLDPSSFTRKPTRSPFLLFALKTITLECSTGIALSWMPPGSPTFGFGFTCFLATFTPSTSTRPSGKTSSTVPRWPLDLPVFTITSSPFLILFITATVVAGFLENLWRQRNNLHKPIGAKLARHGAENTGTDRLEAGIQKHCSIAVEADQRTVFAPYALARTNDHGVVDLAFLHLAARNRVLDADLDHVTNVRITALGAAQHLDALNATRTGIVRRFQNCLHLK